MVRTARLIALSLAVVPASPAFAQGATMRAELATLQPANRELVIDGRMWTCSANACTAPGGDPRPAVACRKLARKLGPVTRFTTRQVELDEAGLAACNQDQK